MKQVFAISAWLACAALCAQAADLSFQRLVLLQYDGGPVNPPEYEYVPSEPLWLSARIANFQREAKDREEGLQQVRLSWQVRAEDPFGTLIAPPLRGLIEETLREKEDKDWTPRFQVKLELSAFAPRGNYRIVASIRDEASKQEAKGEVQFRVRGEELPAKDAELGVRDFRFLAKEDDRFGMQPAIYKPGAALFTRFEIIGYAMEGNNHFSVDYGLAIVGPPNDQGASKTVFQQDVAASEASESFYAQRWVPAGFGLNLDPNVAAGDYTLVVTLRDKVSGKSAELRETFTVKP